MFELPEDLQQGIKLEVYVKQRHGNSLPDVGCRMEAGDSEPTDIEQGFAFLLAAMCGSVTEKFFKEVKQNGTMRRSEHAVKCDKILRDAGITIKIDRKKLRKSEL